MSSLWFKKGIYLMVSTYLVLLPATCWGLTAMCREATFWMVWQPLVVWGSKLPERVVVHYLAPGYHDSSKCFISRALYTSTSIWILIFPSTVGISSCSAASLLTWLVPMTAPDLASLTVPKLKVCILHPGSSCWKAQCLIACYLAVQSRQKWLRAL